MSTKIEDLPGPIPEEVRHDLNNIQNNFRRQNQHHEDEIVRQNTLQNSQPIDVSPQVNPEIYRQSPQDSNIQMNIKKRVKFIDENEISETKQSDGILGFMQDQINEDNLLLLLILIVSSRNDLDPYIKNIPAIGNQLGDSLILVTIVRCFLLLVVYLAFRQYVLPKIKV